MLFVFCFLVSHEMSKPCLLMSFNIMRIFYFLGFGTLDPINRLGGKATTMGTGQVTLNLLMNELVQLVDSL